MNKMNKIITEFFALLLISIVFLAGCNNFIENTSDSPLLGKQEVKADMTDSKQSNPVMVNAVQVSLSLVNQKVVLHEPVLLNFTVQNNLAQTIKLDLGQNFKEGFLFTVVFPNGKKVRLPQLTRDGFSSIGDFSLKSQEIYTQKIVLNEWVEFASVGKYKIEGRLANPIKTEYGEIVKTDSSFSVTLDVQPRDADHLEKISALLLESIIQSNSYKERAENALALGYMNDPVAVPYLQKALTSNKMVEPIIINGLERIGNITAVQVLIDTINEKPNSEIASLARYSLYMIERKSSDLEVKEKIKHNLPPE